MINNNNIPLLGDGVICFDIFVFLIDDSDEFQSDIVLKAHCKVGQEEDALFYDPNVGFEYEVFLDCGINVLEKIHLLIFLERDCFIGLAVFFFDVSFHFEVKLLAQLIVVFEFRDGLLIVIVLFILFVDIINCDTDHIDHVAKERSA